ncbi:MAG: hypothetical protein ACYS0K_21975 [Planctomycetota bacterium]|jgi:hypothetical protein
MLTAALVGSVLLTPTVDLRGETIDESFETYPTGTFPAAPWQDVGLIDPTPPNPPNPSATVEEATDASGQQTQVLDMAEAIAMTQGAYRIVGQSSYFLVAADVRVDQWADAPPNGNPAGDWPVAIGLALISGQSQDLAFLPDTSIYVSSVTHDWRVYSLGVAGAFSAFSLDTPATLGKWYRVQMELDTVTGELRTKIWDLDDDILLSDQTNFLAEWTPADGLYDAITISEGELSEGLTQANRAVVDNLHAQVGRLSCPWDLDGSGSVSTADLLNLLGQWGSDPGGPPDFNGDGNVGTSDLLELLGNWGPCE